MKFMIILNINYSSPTAAKEYSVRILDKIEKSKESFRYWKYMVS